MIGIAVYWFIALGMTLASLSYCLLPWALVQSRVPVFLAKNPGPAKLRSPVVLGCYNPPLLGRVQWVHLQGQATINWLKLPLKNGAITHSENINIILVTDLLLAPQKHSLC